MVSPVLPQGIQQHRGQHHHAILLPFALMDGDDHACRVDIADSQTGHLGAPQAGGVDGHQQGTAFEMRRYGEYSCHLLLTEDQRKSLLLAGKGNVLQQKSPLQSLRIEESQRTNGTLRFDKP
jgi:hypothetical protein